jgi:hypothetical protein
MQDINIAVLGARGTGKTTFIRRALSLPNTGAAGMHSRKMAIDGGYYIVRFLEIGFSEIHIGPGNTLQWPETIDNYEMPRIDGAVTIYDVTDEESLANVPEMLSQ